jgi:hypothetical protein
VLNWARYYGNCEPSNDKHNNIETLREHNGFSNHIFLTCEIFKIKKFTCQKLNLKNILIIWHKKVRKPPNHPHDLGWAYKEVHSVEINNNNNNNIYYSN